MNANYPEITDRNRSGWIPRLLAVLTVLNAVLAQGQGAVTFDAVPLPFGRTNYYEVGMQFRVVIPTRGTGSPSHDGMVIEPPHAYANLPSNSTPYMIFLRQFSPDDYVAFSLTNGNTFGLTKVDLADPYSPSSSAVPITFKGYKPNGSTVSQTFSTPGNGANSFLNYQFDSAFASDLTSVEILSTRWAIDNLVFTIPEPGSGSVFLLGLLCLGFRQFKNPSHHHAH